MMTGSAQLDFRVEEEADRPAGEQQASELRQQVVERLQLHRQRRGRAGYAAAEEQPAKKADGAKGKIAATVAERYAQTPSYRAVLAAEARRATEQAVAAAEVARRNAEAVAAEQQRLLSELALWDAPQEFSPETAVMILAEAVNAAETATASADSSAAPRKDNINIEAALPNDQQALPAEVRSLTVRLYEDLPPAPQHAGGSRAAMLPDAEEAMALDAEIAFRQAPVFEHYVNEASVPIAANLLEFPRQLVAPRRARPLLAEGPLLEEAKARSKQLRIFEVEAELISPAPPPVTNAPEWSSIRLEAHTVTALEERPDAPPVMPSLLPPQTAPLELRVMAEAVDGLLVMGGLIGVTAVLAKLAGPGPLASLPTGVSAAIAAAATYVALYVLYQLLFFSLNGQTPGMLYARIDLCTFTDENPSRKALRRRILAQAIAICPLGLGLLWALLDDEGLGWHDRISRMYQRAY